MQYVDDHGVALELTADCVFQKGSLTSCTVFEKVEIESYPPFKATLMASQPLHPRLRGRQSEVEALMTRVAVSLGLESGLIHCELRASDQSFLVIDQALRPGGGFIPDAIKVLGAPDVRLLHVLDHLGITGSPTPTPIASAGRGAAIGLAAVGNVEIETVRQIAVQELGPKLFVLDDHLTVLNESNHVALGVRDESSEAATHELRTFRRALQQSAQVDCR
jgi:hypothetical protein